MCKLTGYPELEPVPTGFETGSKNLGFGHKRVRDRFQKPGTGSDQFRYRFLRILPGTRSCSPLLIELLLMKNYIKKPYLERKPIIKYSVSTLVEKDHLL